MKKKLLSLALACMGLAAGSQAQVIATQDFEAAAAPALPTGWIQASTGSPAWQTGSSFGSTWGAKTGYYNIPTTSKYVAVDDAAYPNQLHDTLKAPSFSLSGFTDPYLNFDCFYYGATKTKSGISEKAFILAATTGAWAIIDSVAPAAWNGSWVRQHVNLSAFAGMSSVKVAFTYSDNADTILGVALDNYEIKNLQNEVSLRQLGYNDIALGVSSNGTTLAFLVRNDGKLMTTLDMEYSLNGGTPVTQSFTGLSVAPYATTVLSFTTPFTGAIAGLNTLKVKAVKVNGIANPSPDTVLTSTFTLATATTSRQGLVEEFSSSTCAPCKSFNANYDPLCTSLNANKVGSNFNVIKYQMNWPNPGTDRSYNADGVKRQTYYACNSIPEHWVNGIPSQYPASPFNSANFTSEAAASYAQKSYVDLTASYKIDTIRKKMSVTVVATPHFTKTGTFHLYTALCDMNYQNTTNTTGQLDYLHVMRKMLPDGNGRSITSWTDGVAQTFTDTGISYVAGNWYAGSSKYPTQNSFDFWSNPLLGSELIAFVQEDASKTILQSFVAVPTNALGVNSVSTISSVKEISIFPNPAKDEATLSFYLGESGNVHIKLVEYTGRVVADVTNGNMTAGEQKVVVPTANVAPGNYLVIIEANGAMNAERITVSK